MAKSGITFSWNRSGYQELMNGREVQALIEKSANQIAAAATGMIDTTGDTEEAFIVKDWEGKLVNCKVVVANSYHARAAHAKYKVLTKAMSAGKV